MLLRIVLIIGVIMWIERQMKDGLQRAVASRPVVLLTGARQTGKSSLLRRHLVTADYVTLDRVAQAAEAEENPARFLRRFAGQVVLDEVQYAPSLFRELKILIDEHREETGGERQLFFNLNDN